MAMREEDYYKQMQDEDFVALQQSEMQLEAARRRALKNTQTQLDAMGMGSSGFGSTARAGIEGQYTQGLMSAKQQYNENVKYHQEQAGQAQTNDIQNYLSTLATFEGDNDAMYNDLLEQGYFMKDEAGNILRDENGNPVWNDDKLAELNPSNVNLLKQGIKGLEYTNNKYNQGLVGSYVTQSISNLLNSVESESEFASGILETLIAAGIITEKTVKGEDGKDKLVRESHLDKLDQTTSMMVQQYINKYDLLNTDVKQDVVEDKTNQWFNKAKDILDKNSDTYKTYMAQGYSEGLGDAYYVQGLGSGRKNDDIDVTIGQSSRDRKNEYDLKCGDPVNDQSLLHILNTIFKDAKNGQLVLYNDSLYIYTKKGWVIVEGDHSDVKDCIQAIKDYVGYTG